MATIIPKNSRTLFSSTSSAKYNYGNSDIKTYLERTLINNFPFASTLMREVSIGYYGSNYPSTNTDRQGDYRSFSSNHKLFVPGYNELGGTDINISGQTKFAYITAGNTPSWKDSSGAAVLYGVNTRDIDYGSDNCPWGEYTYMEGSLVKRCGQNAYVSGHYSFVFNF